MKLLLMGAAIAGIFMVKHYNDECRNMERYSSTHPDMVNRSARRMIYAIVLEIILIIGVAAS